MLWDPTFTNSVYITALLYHKDKPEEEEILGIVAIPLEGIYPDSKEFKVDIIKIDGKQNGTLSGKIELEIDHHHSVFILFYNF